MNCQAPSGFWHLALMPHCHEPAPILGPLPRSTGGRIRASAAYFFTTSLTAQLPVYHGATWPCRKPWSSAGVGLTYLLVNSPWNHWPQARAAAPFSAFSAVVYDVRSIRSPPKLCSMGE